MKFTSTEIGTILAALRLWQQNLSHQHEFIDQNLIEIATNGDTQEQLDADEIDVLCERINS